MASSLTVTPTPGPRWILFRGASCPDPEQHCLAGKQGNMAYYAISDNGAGMETITSFPSGILPPEGAPRPYGEPQLSPGGSYLAYPAYEGLYLVRSNGEQGRYLHRPEVMPEKNPVGPVCWSPDGGSLRYVVRAFENGQWLNHFYYIGLVKATPELLFTLSDLESYIFTGACSPDGSELAFTFDPFGTQHDGIYLVDFQSGDWRPVLPNYRVDLLRNRDVLQETADTDERIYFTGTPCSLRGSGCAPLPGESLHYYAINRDGTGLENVLTIPPRVVPPAGAPRKAFENQVQLSPDSSMLAYIPEHSDGITIMDSQTGTTLWEQQAIVKDGFRRSPFYEVSLPFCWNSDGTKLWSSAPNGEIWLHDLSTGESNETEFTNIISMDWPHSWDCIHQVSTLAFAATLPDAQHRGLQVVNFQDDHKSILLKNYHIHAVGSWRDNPLYTFAPLNSRWQMIFQGFPCGKYGPCGESGPGDTLEHYAIFSDGTGLEKFTDFSTQYEEILLPKGAPDPYLTYKSLFLSPDGTLFAYYSAGGSGAGYYVFDKEKQEVSLLLSKRQVQESLGIEVDERLGFGGFCWKPDGSGLNLYIPHIDDMGINHEFYQIDRNGEHLKHRFSILYNHRGMGALPRQGCSPDYQEMTLDFFGGETFIVHLENGIWRRLLSDMLITDLNFGSDVTYRIAE